MFFFSFFNSLELNEECYKDQLYAIKELISEDSGGPHDEKVVQRLGVGLNALYSVPTAIFCFLRAQKPIKGIQTDNPLRRAIQYAVSYKSHSKLHYNRIIMNFAWRETKLHCLIYILCYYFIDYSGR